MFAYTGFKEDQVKELADVHHIFMTTNGRISIAGLNSRNVEYVAQAFHNVSIKESLNIKNPELSSEFHGLDLTKSYLI